MIVIKNLEVESYRNMKHEELNALTDLNILIGPNNCGKTNISELISSLQHLEVGGQYDYLCPSCRKSTQVGVGFAGIRLPTIRSEDYYLRRRDKAQITLRILLDRQQTEKVAPGLLKQQENRLNGILPGWHSPSLHPIDPPQNKDAITMRSSGSVCLALHLSPFIHPEIIDKLLRPIVYCPDRRLERYNQKDFITYLQERGLRGTERIEWVEFLSKIVDPKIVDERRDNLVRRLDGKDLEVTISEQGSGVRSLACLTADLLFTDAKIVLIDEPELGLNPFVKQEFLKFLLQQSDQRQIFLATHDPTFVNPAIWKDTNVSVYFYSSMKEHFVKVDLAQSKEDPETFAGYMPHTTTLKDKHLYVEGSSDVYIFQIFLRKFLQKHLKEEYRHWWEHWNRIGIYHLAGDFWMHLLYTVPDYPYKCLVVLDGDKREAAKEVCNKHQREEFHGPKFRFCQSTPDAIDIFDREDAHPVYCLEKDCIEEYLDPTPDYKDPSYDKKRDGPKIAELMDEVPEEIKDIIIVILPYEAIDYESIDRSREF